MAARGAGIDVGGDRLHAVVLDAERRVVAAGVWSPGAVDALVPWLVAHGVGRVGVDAPDAPSTAAHAMDATLSNKFRHGRCAEIELGRAHAIWVSWATPVDGPFAGWMDVGFALFAGLRDAGLDVFETYPYAIYRTLAGKRLPSKLRPEGIAARVASVRAAGVVGEPNLAMWSHDSLDALAAAIVAVDPTARKVTCGHDGSAIWLPGPSPQRLCVRGAS